jgi:hypothetical protein
VFHCSTTAETFVTRQQRFAGHVRLLRHALATQPETGPTVANAYVFSVAAHRRHLA